MNRRLNTQQFLSTFGRAARTWELAADSLTRLIQQTKLLDGSICKLLKSMNVVLLISVVLHLGLCLHAFTGETRPFTDRPVRDFLYLLSMFFLVAFFIAHFLLQLVLARRTESTKQRIDAMFYMFSSVKHSLNNDMQVVRGNAELAKLAVEQGESSSKQIRQIVLAADDAIERIEQLGAFSTPGTLKRRPSDLNAVLRQTMAKLTAEVPATVVFRLDLKRLNDRVMVDRFLLELSLSHLIRSAVRLLPAGCEILVRTHHASSGKLRFATDLKTRVKLDIVLRIKQEVSDNLSEHTASGDVSSDFHYLQSELLTTKALLETSGATVAGLETSQKQLQMQLTFFCPEKRPETFRHRSELPSQDTPIRIPAANTSEPPSTT